MKVVGEVAIRHIDRVFTDKADTVRVIRELRFLWVLKHPNIVGVVDVLLPQQRTSFDDTYIWCRSCCSAAVWCRRRRPKRTCRRSQKMTIYSTTLEGMSNDVTTD